MIHPKKRLACLNFKTRCWKTKWRCLLLVNLHLNLMLSSSSSACIMSSAVFVHWLSHTLCFATIANIFLLQTCRWVLFLLLLHFLPFSLWLQGQRSLLVFSGTFFLFCFHAITFCILQWCSFNAWQWVFSFLSHTSLTSHVFSKHSSNTLDPSTSHLSPLFLLDFCLFVHDGAAHKSLSSFVNPSLCKMFNHQSQLLSNVTLDKNLHQEQWMHPLTS